MKDFRYCLAIVALWVVACNPTKDPEPNTPQDPYESCCGVEPVEFVHGAGKIYVPNVITVNADGINDIFYPFVNDAVNKVENFVITDADGAVLYQQAVLNLSNQPSTAWTGYKSDNTLYKGLFHYKMSVTNNAGLSKTLEGSACCVTCDSAAVVFKTKTGCYYPIQFDDLSGFNPAAPNFEGACFEQ